MKQRPPNPALKLQLTKPGGVQTTVKLPGIIDNRIYSLLSTGKTTNGVTSISANCLLCKGGRTIHGDTKSSGNFTKHLRAVHPTQHDEYKKRKSQPPTDETQPSMKKYVQYYQLRAEKLSERTISDCWSSHARAFLGVTCHWINQDFSRESRVLACTRFKGVHSYDRIAEQLISVMNMYGIQKEQVVAIVTDNGSNFCKAFKEFGIEFEHAASEAEKENGDENDFDVSEAEPEDNLSIDDPLEVDLHSVMEKGETVSLPPHVRCTSHSLSLVATKDGLDVKDKRLYNTAIGKFSRPVSLALDKLQGEFGVFMGSLVPTLIRVKAMITEVKEDSECCSKGYATAYLNGIEKRFGQIMKIDDKNPSDYVLAALKILCLSFDGLIKIYTLS
ncbi:putative AC9 transposase [Orchesella cincta]|uniref:Putative AC9 transposase n=1 Tax=Orchesella cincta TaxID=48709 RepID=A0A1D2M2M3_ORCCI|nr:putative AC9 transposase [Orchesella cincta]